MVSPSEIVDTVWHQQLIFTKSYSEFCRILGKQIQHIPSTHNKEDFKKFKTAKEHTTKLYEAHFGEQPKSFWKYADQYESLHLKKSKFKLRTTIIIAILIFIVLIIPLYFLLKPIYLSIKNPDFIIFYSGLIIILLTGLEWYNRKKLNHVIHSFDKDSFIFDLQPFELIYLKNMNISSIISGTVNELIDNSYLKINADKTLSINNLSFAKSREERQIVDTLEDLGKASYRNLLNQLIVKPVFSNIVKSMDAVKKYFIRSKIFSDLFVLNMVLFLFLIMFGLLRMITGILREKPVLQISFAVAILLFLMIGYLFRLTHKFSSKVLPDTYKKVVLSKRNAENDWQWSYFLLGPAVFTTSFIAISGQPISDGSGGSSEGSTSSDSSCGGSSCSSCGGCGGD